jgi:hypothetical protein
MVKMAKLTRTRLEDVLVVDDPLTTTWRVLGMSLFRREVGRPPALVMCPDRRLVAPLAKVGRGPTFPIGVDDLTCQTGVHATALSMNHTRNNKSHQGYSPVRAAVGSGRVFGFRPGGVESSATRHAASWHVASINPRNFGSEPETGSRSMVCGKNEGFGLFHRRVWFERALEGG